MTPPKEHMNIPITNLKDMESCDLLNKEFKISVKEAQSTTRKKKNNSIRLGKQYTKKMRSLTKNN